MGKRKLFLLFLSAMSISIIIMVIIYGLFIKDLDFSLNVKNPEMAPSPIDAFEEAESWNRSSHEKSAASVNAPDASLKEADSSEQSASSDEQPLDDSSDKTPPITEVVPLQPSIANDEPLASEEAESPADASLSQRSNTSMDSLPTLHYVYLDGFSTKDAAEQAIQQLQGRNLAAHPYIRQHKGQIILQFGVFSDKENADAMAQQLRHQNVFVKVD